MAKLTPFYKTASPAVASYDYTDIAAGTGIVEFNASVADSSVGRHPILRKEVINQGNPASIEDTYTYDFRTSSFQIPQTIEGTGTLQLTYAAQDDASANVNFVASLYKHNATTSALMVSVTSQTVVFGATGAATSEVIPLVIPRTHFEKGEVLALVISSFDQGQDHSVIMHDPLNRDTAWSEGTITAATNPTYLKLGVPFAIDI